MITSKPTEKKSKKSDAEAVPIRQAKGKANGEPSNETSSGLGAENNAHQVQRVMLVTGMSGAGKSTVLTALEDLGWETIDNFPVRLLPRLLATPHASEQLDYERPLAIGFDSRTRGFNPDKLLGQIRKLHKNHGYQISILFIDCSGQELIRRYNETRRPHPLALDRQPSLGIAEERSVMHLLRRWAERIIDTSHMSREDLQRYVQQQFALISPREMVVSLTSFGFARGAPPIADLVFDMRYLDNPHWVKGLREKTGLDPAVADHVRASEDFETGMQRMMDLLLFLLPQYDRINKAYVNIAIGCTGGKHRSVFVAEEIGRRLTDTGYRPTIVHSHIPHS